MARSRSSEMAVPAVLLDPEERLDPEGLVDPEVLVDQQVLVVLEVPFVLEVPVVRGHLSDQVHFARKRRDPQP